MKIFAQSCLLVAVVLILGCGGGDDADRPDLVPVKGTLLDATDQPISGATVAFWHVDGSALPASGVTDSNGKFTLMMYDPGDGAIAGKNKVTVTPRSANATSNTLDPTRTPPPPGDPSSLAQQSEDMPEQTGEPPTDTNAEIDPKYADQKNTPLEFDVPAGGTEAATIRLLD